jgi:hypothetical protein
VSDTTLVSAPNAPTVRSRTTFASLEERLAPLVSNSYLRIDAEMIYDPSLLPQPVQQFLGDVRSMPNDMALESLAAFGKRHIVGGRLAEVSPFFALQEARQVFERADHNGDPIDPSWFGIWGELLSRAFEEQPGAKITIPQTELQTEAESFFRAARAQGSSTQTEADAMIAQLYGLTRSRGDYKHWPREVRQQITTTMCQIIAHMVKTNPAQVQDRWLKEVEDSILRTTYHRSAYSLQDFMNSKNFPDIASYFLILDRLARDASWKPRIKRRLQILELTADKSVDSSVRTSLRLVAGKLAARL